MMKILGMLAAGGLVMAAGQAQAAGCNGHVNAMEWGCAPWDNNNGPQFPHYKAPQHHAAPPAHVQPHAQPHVQAPPSSVIGNRNGGRLLGNDGAGVVSQGGGNVVSQGGGNVVSQGGGNVVSQGGGNVVGTGGSSFQRR
jgi:hypothetical protein